MTQAEILRAIENALRAIEDFERQTRLKKAQTFNEVQEAQEIKKAANSLAEHLRYMMGPAGTPCPRCGGSGVV